MRFVICSSALTPSTTLRQLYITLMDKSWTSSVVEHHTCQLDNDLKWLVVSACQILSVALPQSDTAPCIPLNCFNPMVCWRSVLYRDFAMVPVISLLVKSSLPWLGSADKVLVHNWFVFVNKKKINVGIVEVLFALGHLVTESWTCIV